MMFKILEFLLFILAAFGIQLITKIIVSYLDKKIGQSLSFIEESAKEIDVERKDKKASNALADEVVNYKLVQKKKQKLSFFTMIMGFLEILIFVLIGFASLKKLEGNIPEFLLTIIKFAGGWIALKVFGNYQHWSGAVIGRATFYTFIIGSIVNISLASFLGFVVYYVNTTY